MIRKLLPMAFKKFIREIYNNYFGGYALRSYSQEGEDMILRRLLEDRSHGFYVDVGAHHPKRFSNTYFFYKRGWRGINIEPNPVGVELLKHFRKEDINLQVGISDADGSLDYFMFDEPALNTFDHNLAQQYAENWKLIEKKQILLTSLNNVLDKYVPSNLSIDFMSIDVEGYDLNVVKSNDWEKYRPMYVILEVLGKNIPDMLNSDVAKFMDSVSYEPCAKTLNSVFFKNSKI